METEAVGTILRCTSGVLNIAETKAVDMTDSRDSCAEKSAAIEGTKAHLDLVVRSDTVYPLDIGPALVDSPFVGTDIWTNPSNLAKPCSSSH